MKLTRNRIYLLLGVVAVLILITLLPKKKMQLPEQESATYTVKTQLLEKQDLQEYLTMNGNVKSDNTIAVYPDIGGKLVHVPVTLGSYVKRGDLIAQVDPSTPGTVYALSPVYSTIDGFITSLPLTQGTTVTTSTAIAQIGNIKKLQIEAKVPERDIAVLKTGLNAVVSLEAYPGESFPAHIIRISPILDETSRTKEIYYIFDTDDERVNAGMYAKIKLYTTLHKNILAIPINAYQTIDGIKYAYILNDDQTVTRKEITTGIAVDALTEVTSGLNEGERIVVSGIQVLADGVSVKDIGGK